MKVKTFTFSPFQENTYVIYDETKEAVIVDPGCSNTEENNILKAFIESNGLKPVKLINTHCHIDHVFGWDFVYQTWGLKPYYHPKDSVLLPRVGEQAKMFGFEMKSFPSDYGFEITEDEKVTFGHTELDIMFCPGHAPGHIVFYHQESNICLVGDVIFRQSVGRTDLPYCDPVALEHSIRTVIYNLPDDCTLYSGHGLKTTVGHEKKNNPFVRSN